MFGREDLEAVYRAASNLFFELKLGNLKHLEELDGVKRLTICNLWRIDRYPDTVKTYEFSLTTREWFEVQNIDNWPDMPIWPIFATKETDFWKEFISKAAMKALLAVGYIDLPERTFVIPTAVLDAHYNQQMYRRISYQEWRHKVTGSFPSLAEQKALGLTENPPGYKKEMSRDYMGRIFTEQMMRGLAKTAHKGARALRAVFWDHIKDKRAMSAILALHFFRKVGLHAYLKWARYPAALTQRRNLLPLLDKIAPNYWHRTDLFSRKLWVRGDRKYTLVDRKSFTAPCEYPNLRSFASAAEWRWLSNAPLRVVQRWIESSNPKTSLSLAHACGGIKLKIPVIAITQYISEINRFHDQQQQMSDLVHQHLCRLYLTHAAEVWQVQGHKSVKEWVRSSTLPPILDYLCAEGLAAGQPSKNATWASLARRSDAWHEQVAQQQSEADKLLTWDSGVDATYIDDVEIKPIENADELALQGRTEKHCVGVYKHQCVAGSYRVFAITTASNDKSTLGVRIADGRIVHTEHRARLNTQPCAIAASAAAAFIQQYQRVLLAGVPLDEAGAY